MLVTKAIPFIQSSKLVTPETITPNFSAEAGTHVVSDHGYISQMDAGPGPILSQAELQRGAFVIGLGDSHVASAPHKVVRFRK